MLMIFTACTIAAGDCREIVMPIADDVRTPFQCMLVGQQALAEWQNGHVAYRVDGGRQRQPPSRLARAI